MDPSTYNKLMIISVLRKLRLKKGQKIRDNQTTGDVPLVQRKSLEKIESDGMILRINSHNEKGSAKCLKSQELNFEITKFSNLKSEDLESLNEGARISQSKDDKTN